MSDLRSFFEVLNNNDVKYSVLRNYKYLPDSTGGSDLDILVFEESVINFDQLLSQFIKANNLNLVSVVKDGKSPKYCITCTDWGVQIDLFKESVFFGGKEIILSSILSSNTEKYSDILILNKKVAALLAFLKELLNNKTCAEKYIVDLQNQFGGSGVSKEWLCQFTPEFSTYLNLNLNELNKKHCSFLYELSEVSFKRSQLYGLSGKIKRLYKQPGFTVAILGTDGSGKSTIIDSITAILNDAFHKGVYYEHMRPNQIPSLARLMGNKEVLAGPVSNPHGSAPSGFLGSFLRWVYYMLDYTFGFYLKIWPKKAIRSCVWIFDRYYYDYLIDPKRARINLPKWILKIGQLIIPEPDIIICLGTDAQIIHQRKPELPLMEVERQVVALKEFCDKNKRAIWVDTGKSIQESSNDTLSAIIDYMHNRFKNVKLI